MEDANIEYGSHTVRVEQMFECVVPRDAYVGDGSHTARVGLMRGAGCLPCVRHAYGKYRLRIS